MSILVYINTNDHFLTLILVVMNAASEAGLLGAVLVLYVVPL